MIKTFQVGCCCLLVLFATGCVKPTAQISGQVEFEDGTHLQGAIRSITLIPADDSTANVRQSASGIIKEDGSFKLQGRKPNEGVQKGQYAVTITALKHPRFGGLLVPEKYTSARLTPFTIDVTHDQDDLLFQLEKPE